MASKFSDAEWRKIHECFATFSSEYGLPERRDDSVVIGTFNIRKLGVINNRSQQSWKLLIETLSRFDLIAIQEVMDDLSGLEFLLESLGGDYGMVVSDVTGKAPGKKGNAERLAYIFNWKRVERTALASDITYDRSEIAKSLYNDRALFADAWDKHTHKLGIWAQKVKDRKAAGKRAPSAPSIALPKFVSFIRQPHYVSFKVLGRGGSKPYEFLVVNAHLLYGEDPKEREWEFLALTEWLTVRAKQSDKLYHPNLLLLGDCNLDFDEETTVMRDQIDSFIKGLNKKYLKSSKAAKANFPLLTPHPSTGEIRTALRQEQTYDQIGLFARDERLPGSSANEEAGTVEGGYDYGVFNIAEMIAQALHNQGILEVSERQRKAIYKKSEFDISDHMPAWIRLSLP